ncbi:MAG: tetratricopeptide repeat protein [Azoarcus sp.]|jgi:tetratricopeptide (TPR) repeat protein|nr:tetratricopeptide repeat protein [Azoarcus sp.]
MKILRPLSGRHAAARLVTAVALSLVTGLTPVHAQKRSVHDTREQATQALFDQGVAAANQNDDKTALTIYEQVAQRYGKGSPPAMRTLAAKALLNKGGILGEQGDAKGAIATYQRLDLRFGQDKDQAIREVVASALVSKAEASYKQGDAKAAVATYEQIEKRFAKDGSSFIRQLVAITKWRTAEILADSAALSSRR